MLKDLPDLAEQVRQGFAISNLTVLASLVGTEILNKPLPKVLALEDTGEKPYRLVRSLAQLHYSGMLQKTTTIIFGQIAPAMFSELKDQIDLYFGSSFRYRLYHWPYFGHENSNFPLKFMRPNE